jgi:hypothetical protein
MIYESRDEAREGTKRVTSFLFAMTESFFFPRSFFSAVLSTRLAGGYRHGTRTKNVTNALIGNAKERVS